MPHVQVRPSRDLRNNYREIANTLKENNPVIITNNGKGEAVLISMEDYAKFEDFQFQQYVVNALDEAEKEASSPNAKWYSHEEVKANFLNRKKKNNV